jgi:hypothetical protein
MAETDDEQGNPRPTLRAIWRKKLEKWRPRKKA